MNDNSVSLSEVDTIDEIDSIDAIDEMNVRMDGRYYTECQWQCVRCDGSNRRNEWDRCDEGIGEDHVRINLTAITQFIWRGEI